MAGLGNITQDGYTVWCGFCCEWSSMNSTRNKRECAKTAMRFGWKKLSGKWACPECVKLAKK